MARLRIDGLEQAYVRRGTGPALVLIHGYPFDHTIWDKVAPLLDRDFELIIPDLRGFGESGVMEDDHSIDGYAHDLAGLLTHLKIRKTFIAGHSMGGYVALAFARGYPDRISGLGLVSSQVVADTPERKKGRYETADQVMLEGTGIVAESMAPKLTNDTAIQAFARELISRQQPLAVARALRAMADRPDSTDLFMALKFPIVIVHGEADALIPIERAREMKAALQSAHLVELPEVGHLSMLENAEAVADGLRFFLTVQPKEDRLLRP
jgi:pimeloyl-ACP methyl ester carboxylesterase